MSVKHSICLEDRLDRRGTVVEHSKSFLRKMISQLGEDQPDRSRQNHWLYGNGNEIYIYQYSTVAFCVRRTQHLPRGPTGP